MANEVSVSTSISVSKNGATISSSATKTLNMDGDQMISNVQIVGTAWEQVLLGDLGTPLGEVMFKNLDSANFVELALDSGGTNKICKIQAGSAALFAPTTATLYARADTAAVNLFVVGAED